MCKQVPRHCLSPRAGPFGPGWASSLQCKQNKASLTRPTQGDSDEGHRMKVTCRSCSAGCSACLAACRLQCHLQCHLQCCSAAEPPRVSRPAANPVPTSPASTATNWPAPAATMEAPNRSEAHYTRSKAPYTWSKHPTPGPKGAQPLVQSAQQPVRRAHSRSEAPKCIAA